jgi:DNA repair protein RadC
MEICELDDTDILISKALLCLEKKLRYEVNQKFISSKDVCSFARLQLAAERDEVFGGLFLNNHNQLIAFEKLFYGTINEATVYPRKIVNTSLKYNAAKIIIMHNHPSGNCKPSKADIDLTQTLKEILNIVDVQLIDHIIVSVTESFSFAEAGLV